MKDFPAQPPGKLGPWYRRVNERVARAKACDDPACLVELLGEPDTVAAVGEVITPSQIMARLGSRFRFEDQAAEIVMSWVDPYRPARHYHFGITGGRVTSNWIEMVSR